MRRRDKLCIFVAVVLGAVFGLHRIVDPDLFQRIALGREILASPAALGASHLLDPVAGFRFVDDKWLSSVLVAAIYRVGNEQALMTLQILLAASLAAAWYAMLRVWGAAKPVALCGTAMALVADAYRLEPRPDTLSQVFAAALITLLGSRCSFVRLRWLVPLLMAFWANFHGYFVEGILILGAAVAATALGESRLIPESPGDFRRRTARMGALAGLGSAACCLHPQGLSALVWPWEQLGILAREPLLREAIQEFFPARELVEGTTPTRGLLLVGVTLAGVAVARSVSRRTIAGGLAVRLAVPLAWLAFPGPGFAPWPYRCTFALAAAALLEIPDALADRRWFPVLLFSGSAALAVPLVRNLSAVPPAAMLLLAPAWAERLRAFCRAAARRQRTMRPVLVGTAAAIVLVAGYARLADRLVSGTYRRPAWTGWGVETRCFPAAAAEFLARENVPGPLLNNFDVGGFLLARLGPGHTVFIADNTSMYPPEFLAEYRRTVMGSDGPAEDLHRELGVRSILLDHAAMETPKLLARLARSGDWPLVFVDREAAIFVHREPATEPFLAQHALGLDEAARRLGSPPQDLPVVPAAWGGRRHLFPTLNYGIFLRALGRPDLALVEADRLWNEGPASELATFSAAAAEEAHRLPEMVGRLEDALRREPESEVLCSWTSRALFFRADRALAEERYDAARRDLTRCRVLTPAAPGPLLALARIAVASGKRGDALRLLGEAFHLSPDGSARAQARADAALAPLLEP